MATPNPVDTLPGPVTVHVSVHAVDVEGVTGVGASLHACGSDMSGPSYFIDGFKLVSGTANDGIWAADVQLPQGTPSGAYCFQSWVQDAAHWRSYMSASSPYAGDPTQRVMAWDPKVTVR